MTRYGVASAQIWTESYVGAHHFSAKLDLTRSGLTPPLCLVHFHSWYSRAGFCPWGPTHSLWKDHKGQDRIQSHAFYTYFQVIITCEGKNRFDFLQASKVARNNQGSETVCCQPGLFSLLNVLSRVVIQLPNSAPVEVISALKRRPHP